ncbi:hypothetical protein [Negadavirga shengliensis]|uniref:Uncharacterized protein n=1 Tax=Negadavirga shengliensis TaxID=1389218 RepID=A0ABV9T190_9BACT
MSFSETTAVRAVSTAKKRMMCQILSWIHLPGKNISAISVIKANATVKVSRRKREDLRRGI